MATLDHILERIEGKKLDYQEYAFTQTESTALTTFFDLAQEFEHIDDFYCLCVAVPRGFFGLHARLYLIDPKHDALVLLAQTGDSTRELYAPPPAEVKPLAHPYCTTANSLVLPIRGNEELIDQLPFKIENNVFGLLELYPVQEVTAHTSLFFEKYANRIGFNLHNRFLREKNIEHLRFIRTLVADIEHNVIVPNMVNKLFLRQLKGKITKNREIEKQMKHLAEHDRLDDPRVYKIIEELSEVNRGLAEEFENIEKHYLNMSLFLETLLRRSHFDQGKLTVRRKSCNMKKDVIQPQLERFLDQFKQAGIYIDDQLRGIPDEEVISVVDVGLIAQVYANLFSNALKYTQEVITNEGKREKYVSYGREIIPDYFGPGRDGVKYNVFSTGPHIKPEEQDFLFEEEYRGSNAQQRPGTGHGLTFVKNAVEIHGGVVGYEPTPHGNNFYFILPRTSPEETTATQASSR